MEEGEIGGGEDLSRKGNEELADECSNERRELANLFP